MSANNISGRKRKASEIADGTDEARPTTRAATRKLENERKAAAGCIWRLPQEIRDIIYGYVLSTPHTKSPPQALHMPLINTADEICTLTATVNALVKKEDALKKLKQTTARKAKLDDVHRELERAYVDLAKYATPLQMDVMRANKQMCEEVTKYIKERVLVSFKIDGRVRQANTTSLLWTKENETWLLRAQHIFIRYHLPHQHQALPPAALRVTSKQALEHRADIKTFEFQGCGVRVLENRRFDHVDGLWKSFDPWTVYFSDAWDESCDSQLYGQIMQVLRGLPRVKASKKVRIGWAGDERFPAEVDDTEVKEYQKAVKELQK